MKHVFTLVCAPGPAWAADKPMGEQPHWAEHTAFLDALVDNRSVALRAVFASATRLLVIVEAEYEQDVMDIYSCDPFVIHGIVVLGAHTRWLPYQDVCQDVQEVRRKQ